MPIEIRQVRPEEHLEAGRVTALAYREFADNDDWDRYVETIANISARAGVALVLVAVEDGEILGSAPSSSASGSTMTTLRSRPTRRTSGCSGWIPGLAAGASPVR
ncbi:MAG: hypothetical protein WD670_07615 [Actinomycetota bacterium]